MSDVATQTMTSVFHPTDFSASSDIAFRHALKIAVENQSMFSVMHVASMIADDGPAWSEFPQIRETLEQWALLPKGSPKEAVADKLGLKVKKVESGSSAPLAAMAGFLEKEPADLIVLSTEGREGLPRWFNPSVSESLARKSKIKTLFVPNGAKGFVSPDRGDVRLERVLIPVDQSPAPEMAVDAADMFLRSIDAKPSKIEILYVGSEGDMPDINTLTSYPDCSVERTVRQGNPIDEIIKAADHSKADLIVMTTAGHEGFLDALRGSTTEQVLRQAPCPVLAIPAMAD